MWGTITLYGMWMSCIFHVVIVKFTGGSKHWVIATEGVRVELWLEALCVAAKVDRSISHSSLIKPSIPPLNQFSARNRNFFGYQTYAESLLINLFPTEKSQRGFKNKPAIILFILRDFPSLYCSLSGFFGSILSNIQRSTSELLLRQTCAFDYMYKAFTNVIVDDPDLIYAQFLQHSQCYETMSSNNKVVVFTDDLSVRKAFYGLLYNSTRTGLIADSATMQVTGVLSITDFTMVLMMLWKFRKNCEETKEKPLSYSEFEAMDILNVTISRWKEILKMQDMNRGFISINSNESVYRAVELLTKHRIHRLPVLDQQTGNCTFILTHRRILHYLWKHCCCLSRPYYMYERVADLKIGIYTGIHYATQDMILMDVLDMIIDNGISGVPVVEPSTMKIVDVYTRFDAVAVAFFNNDRHVDIDVGSHSPAAEKFVEIVTMS
ncbi:hypothetical protein KIN20_035816 [Parelaphostrongylus tenuis]|uniref:CBS domain-containing protein n=1 Tax=Parelaphostrongylus tenuis TaxID=148309 RepID=A0AAD5RF76_PARTN|nr:hypothetical protein KIN20_035816 [Parelaphostrongylus tenuis]